MEPTEENEHARNDGSFIIEISFCGSVTCCTNDGNELEGEKLSDMNDCNGSGDAEPACKYILDTYKPEFCQTQLRISQFSRVAGMFAIG